VIIRDLYLMRPVNFPDETDAILIVDPDAVLSDASSFQRFQPIARRYSKVAQVDGRFDLVQFAESDRADCSPSPAGTCFIELLRDGVLEALDHLRLEYNAMHDM
jgi:hypothetical protein